MGELKEFILNALIGKSEDVGNDERQQKIIEFLSEEFYPTNKEAKTLMFNDICSLILKTIHYQMINGSVSPSDKTIWSLLTREFCITCAYEYIMNVERHNKLVAEIVPMGR